MNIFISGGAKNGKSSFAQEEAVRMAREKNCDLYYVATMIPHDEEDEERIARHIRERAGMGFVTIECGSALKDRIKGIDGVFLIDSVTALLSNEMFKEDGSVDCGAGERLKGELSELAREKDGLVFVSDYIYSDAMAYGELTEEYKRGLAEVDRELAKMCDRVVEVSLGLKIEYKNDYRTELG